ncbi:hypothetical protein HaLaN_16553 [Haematococcus lacustris]|uniref:Uncharacterized protein n=1 Tax=Haematococcus lacustris TaxID=44745 RepID=A0A699ZAA3_HAELA|nr:hypothetical protein HaLaN_16553 [Haematococcus lacustris]
MEQLCSSRKLPNVSAPGRRGAYTCVECHVRSYLHLVHARLPRLRPAGKARPYVFNSDPAKRGATDRTSTNWGQAGKP